MWLLLGVLTLEPTIVLVSNGIKNPSFHYFYLHNRINNAAFIDVTNFRPSHTVHSPTDAHSLELGLKFTLKLDGSYIFRPTTIIRELAIEPG